LTWESIKHMSAKDFEKARLEAPLFGEKLSFFEMLSGWMLKVSRNFEIPFLLLCLIGPHRKHFFSVPSELALYGAVVFSLVLALALRMWAKGFEKERVFIVEGPYRYVRNPVEISTLFGFFGVSVILDLELWYVGALMLSAILWMSIVSAASERKLYLSMGPSFLRYRQRVRRWFPSLLPEFNRSGYLFSFRRAFREERSVLVWVVAVAIIYATRVRF